MKLEINNKKLINVFNIRKLNKGREINFVNEIKEHIESGNMYSYFSQKSTNTYAILVALQGYDIEITEGTWEDDKSYLVVKWNINMKENR